MVKLSVLPFALPIAQWIWALEEENGITTTTTTTGDFESRQLHAQADECLSYLDQWALIQFAWHSNCLSVAISRLAGIGIIIGACFNKAPTVMNMLEAKSAAGFSRLSLYLECLFYANSGVYSWQQGHPITAYGENLVLLVQTMVMVALVWHFSAANADVPPTTTSSTEKSSSVGVRGTEKIAVVLLSILYFMVTLRFLPPKWQYLLHAFNDVIILYSGGLQVRETYRIQHTGAQSILTTSMNLIGELLRVFTTIEETNGDINMLLSFGLCVALSAIMFGQYFYYQRNTQQFYADQKEKSKAKTE